MTNNRRRIVEAALAARTPDEADAVQAMIEAEIGARHQRPVGDRWNNQGLLTGSGASYDHKALELVTNMQDAVTELYSLQRYGRQEAVPFRTPHQAADSLLGHLSLEQRAELATVTIDSAGSGGDKKRVTLIMRDRGCGISNHEVPRSIFHVGARSKDGVDWQQGTFGLGGATTYRNAEFVVLVTRRHPDLFHSGENDAISISVVQWERERTTTNAFYLVANEWDERNPSDWSMAVPFSVSADCMPEFEPGTHLALISYDTEGLGVRPGDERAFDIVCNTRLFHPTLPIEFRNNIIKGGTFDRLSGLSRRLLENPRTDRKEGKVNLPFRYRGVTYQLPLRYWVFSKPGEPGARRRFVAKGHALIVTSNGQVHSHWSPQQFKANTELKKLHDRILVEVESDSLPIEFRTQLFTADRTQFVKSSDAIRLEKEISSALNDVPELHEANRALIREAITGDNSDRPTIAIARQIARALRTKGFSLGGRGRTAPRPPMPTPEDELYADPTHLEGPETVQVVTGTVRSIFFKINAKDGFVSRRARLRIDCDHPDIGELEITQDELRRGRLRVSIAVPENADLGVFKIDASLTDWTKSSGGLGPRMEWCTKLEVVEAVPPPSPSPKPQSDKPSRAGGNLVGLIWKSDEDDDEWDAATVGAVEMIRGLELANRGEYAELSQVDDEIPTVILNRTYSHLKSYVQARATELSDEGKDKARDRYAVGVGVGLLVLDAAARQAEHNGQLADDRAREQLEKQLAASHDAVARAVLSVMPQYDQLAKEAGLEG